MHRQACVLTPAMQGVLDRIRRAGHTPLYELRPPEARAAYQAGAEVLDLPRAAMARIEEFEVPTGDGARLRARLYRPRDASALPALLYFHGGGFTIGGIDTHDSLCRQLAALSGAAVLSLDYRLAPEYKFPTAVNDAWDTLRWLARAGPAIGVDPARLAVGGDSAGGTLAAVCALLARDHGLPLRLQLLFYPGTTGHQDTGSHALFAQGHLIEKTHIDWFFRHYLRSPQDRNDWRFAPLYADETEGVAPAWIGLAECDPLVDEGLAYADKLRVARVPVDLEIYRGVTHDFIKMGRAIPEARHAHAAAAAALKNALFD